MKSSPDPGIVERFASKGVFPHQLAFTLLIPFRNFFLSPSELVKRLGLTGHSRVLEVGPGPGYFSVPVARAVAKGMLCLTDIQQEMLDYAEKRLRKRGIGNTEFKLCNGKELPFADGGFDVVFLVTVLGEIENREAYAKEFHRVLRPGGILSISELPGDPDAMKLPEIERLLVPFGFELDHVFGKGRNFTANFRKV